MQADDPILELDTPLMRACLAHLDSQHATIYGKAYYIQESASREAASRWLAAEVVSVMARVVAEHRKGQAIPMPPCNGSHP